MRAVIQRVSEATIHIDTSKHSEIGKGLLVLLGIEDSDSIDDITWLCGKISKLRIFNDLNEVMNLSVKEVEGEIMVVSQFTLHAGTKKGNRPSYIRAARPEIAVSLYEKFIKQLSLEVKTAVKTGAFGAHMQVNLVNDGPVTIIIDTKNKE